MALKGLSLSNLIINLKYFIKKMEVIGIDVSKLTLDCCIHGCEMQEKFKNDLEGIDQLSAWTIENSGVAKENILFVFEHTGLYSYRLTQRLDEKGYRIHVASGLEIKRSMGITRGKDDKADARRIALYGYRIREEVKPYQKPRKALSKLKRLMSLRKKLVVQHSSYKGALKEQKEVFEDEEIIFQAQQEIMKVLAQKIIAIEKEMDRIIREDPELKEMQKLLTSIKGIGKVTARFLIVYTMGFTSFKTWRKFASYIGIAPFPHSSGTSIRGKTKVSRLANLEGKALLHLCATSAIQCSPEMKTFYQRRLEKGKNKMSTLNIIRNKLLARAFAVIERQSPYVNTMKYAS